MRRGEVWWAEIPQPVGPRPVVILTRNTVVNTINSFVVATVTTQTRGLASEVNLGKSEGLQRPCVVRLDTILTLPRQRLTKLLGALSKEKLNELNAALRFALEIS